jgi:hypothetical protein
MTAKYHINLFWSEARFKTTNPHFDAFDSLGGPGFAGCIFNGFDTARKRRTTAQIEAGVDPGEKEMIQADRTMHGRVASAIAEDLIAPLKESITTYNPIADGLPNNFRGGDIEDASVRIQNSLWLNVPLTDLDKHEQVVTLRDRRKWAENQIE